MIAWLEVYACLNMSMISATFWLADGTGETGVGVAAGRGLFITSAMLGFCFVSKVLGVGGCMERCAILVTDRFCEANSVSIERSRTFFFTPGLVENDGARLRDLTAGSGKGSELGGVSRVGLLSFALAPRLVSTGNVGLSGKGMMLHVLPCL